MSTLPPIRLKQVVCGLLLMLMVTLPMCGSGRSMVTDGPVSRSPLLLRTQALCRCKQLLLPKKCLPRMWATHSMLRLLTMEVRLCILMQE